MNDIKKIYDIMSPTVAKRRLMTCANISELHYGKNEAVKVLLLCWMGIIGSILLTGCGRNTLEVTISDGYSNTLLETCPGKTVEQLLCEADIRVGEKDEISPALDEVITEENAKIVINRFAKVKILTKEADSEVELTGGTVKMALEKAGIKPMKNDYINHDLSAYLTDNMEISVVHRMEITLMTDGMTKKLLTRALTVQELLEEQQITLGEIDRVSPKLTEALENGGKVVVQRVEIKELIENEPVPFETEVTYSNSMLVGTSIVNQEGVNGEKRVTYKVTYVDGKEESREVVKEEIIKKAVSQVLVQGSKPKGKTVVSKERVDDCDGSGHGYYVITYSDGSVEYKDY
ncbi:MAG: ubiquitin-like domain-containing protein [Lachnospiraceae bacterium]|nr:ubiquitin-like domain-containing protein [Lachnospiraceae bacterium]